MTPSNDDSALPAARDDPRSDDDASDARANHANEGRGVTVPADASPSEAEPATHEKGGTEAAPAETRPPRPVKGVKEATGHDAAAKKAMAHKALSRASLLLPERDAEADKRPAGLVVEEARRARLLVERRAQRDEDLAAVGRDDEARQQLEAAWAQEDAQAESLELGEGLKEVEVYSIQEPFSYVQILFDRAQNEMRYRVIEPMLSAEEQLLLEFIESTIVDVLDVSPADLEQDNLEGHLESLFDEVVHDYSIMFTPEPAETAELVLATFADGPEADDESASQPGPDASETSSPAAPTAKETGDENLSRKARRLQAKAAKEAERSRAKAAKKENAKGKRRSAKTKAQAGKAILAQATDATDVEVRRELVRQRLLYYVKRDFLGEGPIDALMKDDMIEDVSCDGPHQPLFVYHRKHESMQTTVQFRNHAHLDGFVIRLAQRSGKHVSIAEPIIDATMTDGSRLQATYGREVSSFGSTFTIRKFRETPLSPIDLVRYGTMDSRVLSYVWMVIENRASGMFAGGTASGKTTALNACTLFIPPSMKIVSIEDTREIQLPQPNWIAGITRGGFGPRDAGGRQAGEIDMFQLLRNALRQRPEYILVGEVRGAEAYNLFQAMATGHAAYGTLHADSVDAAIHRLESDPINIPRPLLEALDLICVQVLTRVGALRVRRTKSVTEIVGLDPNTKEILTNEVFRWDPGEDSFVFTGTSYNLQRIALETGTDTESVMQEWERRTEIINYLLRHKMHGYADVAKVVQAYYKRPDATFALIEEDRPWA